MGDSHARELPDGTIEIVDSETGVVLDTRVSFEEAYALRVENQGIRSSFKYSEHLGDIICQRLAEGISLSKICDTPGFPTLSEVARWTVQYPLFKAKFKQARRAIALQCADKMLAVAELGEGEPGYISKEAAPGKK